MHVVDRDRRGNRERSVAACRNQTNPEQHANIALPTEFDGWRERQRMPHDAVELNWPRRRVRRVASAHTRLPVASIDGLECEHPSARRAVFPGGVNDGRTSWFGAPAKP